MVSRFITKFKRTDGDELRAFQLRVLGVLSDLYPDRSFSLTDDPHTLESSGEMLGLTNIRSHFLLTTETDHDLRTIVADHFGNVWPHLDLADRKELDWEQARRLLMPQLMPSDFLQKLDLVASEFGGGVVAGVVIDAEKAYSYVTKEDLERWKKSSEDVFKGAVDRLDDRSHEMEATVIPGQMVVVNTMDSFDAARILVPRLRDKIAEFIGSPFIFGVPNRDFLICWAQNAESDFQTSVRSQIARDFEEQPYPLSPGSFRVNEHGEIRQIDEPTLSSSSQNAEMN